MKKLNIFLIIISVLFSFSMQLLAQNGGRRFDRDDFFSKRNAYIAAAIELTTEEAAVFFPMDNDLIHKKFELGRECRKIERELREKKDKTDDECNKLLRCKEDVKEKSSKLDREYQEKFKKVLSAEKMLKYERADRDFFESYFRNR
jgi:hypothetical protein